MSGTNLVINGGYMDKEKALQLMWEIRENISNDVCYLDYREAMQEGIRALEKQIPRRPIYSDFEDYNDDGRMIPTKAVCPTCGEEFEFLHGTMKKIIIVHVV